MALRTVIKFGDYIAWTAQMQIAPKIRSKYCFAEQLYLPVVALRYSTAK